MLGSKPHTELRTRRLGSKLRVELLEDRVQPGSVLPGWGFSLLDSSLERGLLPANDDTAPIAQHRRENPPEVVVAINLAPVASAAAESGAGATSGSPAAPAAPSTGGSPALPLTSDLLALSGGSLRANNVPAAARHLPGGQLPVSAGPQAVPIVQPPAVTSAAALHPVQTQLQTVQQSTSPTASATPIPSGDVHHVTATVVAHDSATGQGRIHPNAGINWTTYVSGTTGSGTGKGVAVDSSGNVYTTGYTVMGTTTTAFVAEYSSSGSRLAITAFQIQDPAANYTQSEGHGIAVDDAGDVYVVGKATDATPGGVGADAFIMKFDATNQLMPVPGYGMTLGGAYADSAEGIAVDAAGDATITGTFQPTPDETDLFAAKFTAAGSIAFVQFYTLPQSAGSAGTAVALDSTGANAYLAGSILPTGGDNDILVMQIDNTTGNPVYALTMPNAGNDDTLNGVAVDEKGQAYVAGTVDVEGTMFGYVAQVSADGKSFVAQSQVTIAQTGTGLALDPSTDDVYVEGSGPPGSSVVHAYVEKFDRALTPRDIGYTFGSASDTGSGIAYDPNSGNAYVVGTATSSDLATDGTTLNGPSDAFLTNIGSFA